MNGLQGVVYQWTTPRDALDSPEHRETDSIEATVSIDCLLDCGGEHRFSVRIWGSSGERYVADGDWAPRPTACLDCGNVVALTSITLQAVCDRADEWSVPLIKDLRREYEFARSLWERVWGLLSDDGYDTEEIGETLSGFKVDILRTFQEEASGDYERFDQLFKGSWEEVVLPFLKYAKESEDSPRFLKHLRWRLLLQGEGSEEESRAEGEKLVGDWLHQSFRFFRRNTGLLTEDDVYYYVFGYWLASSRGEAWYILRQFQDWRPYGDKTKQFRIVKSERDDQVFYQLERK